VVLCLGIGVCRAFFFPKKMFRGTLSLTQENHHFVVQI